MADIKGPIAVQRPPWETPDRTARVSVSAALEMVVVSVCVGMLQGPTWYVRPPNLIERAFGVTFSDKVEGAKAKARREADRVNLGMRLAEEAAA